MKKFIEKNLFTALTLILALALVFPALNVSAKNKEIGKYEVKVSYGIDGKYRAMKFVPVTVDMKSLEKDFKGEIEIRVPSRLPGSYDSYSRSVNIAKGESGQAIIPVRMPETDSKFTVNIMEDGKSVLEQKIIFSNGRVSEGNLFAGVLTDDFTSLGYLSYVNYGDIQSGRTGALDTVKLDIDNIGDNHLNIDGLDLIFINNFNMGNFSEENYKSLNAWVNKGGTLIIGAGVNESKTVKIIDKSLLEIKSNGTSNKSVKLVNDSLDLTLSSLEIKNSKVKIGSQGQELVYSVEKGKGEILVTTFDLGTEPLISSKDASEIWNKLLVSSFGDMRDKYKNGGMNYNYQTENLIKNIPVDKVVNVLTLAIIIAIYALTIGIVLYIVLKKMKKRDLIWVAVPTLAVGFALVIYLTGSSTRVNDLIVNQVNIIDINKDGKGQVKGCVGVGTKYKDDVTIEKPQNIVMNFMDASNGYYGMPEEQVLDKLRVKTAYKNNNSYFEFKDSNALEMKQFEISGKEEILPKIESTFNYDGGNLNGKIKNNLDSNINKLILVSGENVWDLGTVKKGEELSIDKLEISKASGVSMYGDELASKYVDVKYNKKGDVRSEEFKNITRYGNVLQMLSSEIIFNAESKLIAITDMEVDYGIEFGKKTLSKYDTTVLVQGSEIDFKDKDGNTNFPQGYFKGVVESTAGSANEDKHSGLIYGDGEMIYSFKVNDETTILNINVNKSESRYGNQGNKGSAEYYVYNYKNSEYEKIALDSSKEITLSNEIDYSVDNKIKVKVVLKDATEGQIPKLTIKGKVK
ncbi:hypothetical protein [Clostridium gasigenes]|uniref:Uncharacterized protein n=1 Tax=Clostridium gasigenes TaxID=94869 RepID=A0A1H0MQH7_9CLOT|nr:hypothetical protein [Clostridium gasigenes]MBU3131306.1 hypothetical protein [Clostridium gasigenes]NKF08093.1 hypothetical protein [Clostridium gasigenes]QSW18552.1 hypothetical protein J1C67_13480 [Clostridium gasigenes]SDO82536.1 hypothetical protein SAMN04488529_101536 [Clostridium gasigenes]